MSQYDFGNLESPLSGTTFFNTHLEPWRNAVHSNHAGTSRPSYASASMMWVNNSANPHVINYFDGSEDISVGLINTSSNIFTMTGHIKSADPSAGCILYNSDGTTVATFGAGPGITAVFEGLVRAKGTLQADGLATFPDKGELTIASGAITVTGVNHTIDTESDAATDDLITINGGADGAIIFLSAENTARTVVLKDGDGNIETPNGVDIWLDDANKQVILLYSTATSKWHVLYAPPSDQVIVMGNLGGGTKSIDLSLGRSFSMTVDTSTTTFTFSNPLPSGLEDIFTLRLTNGGSQTVNWPASVDWVGGTAPTLTASGVDELTFKTIDGGTTWVGLAALDAK